MIWAYLALAGRIFLLGYERIIVKQLGVISGQNIGNRLNTLFAPVYNERNFDNFQIPFLFIATDIETGEEVVFREGYLPKIIRSSMSIPSVFNPIEIYNRLLVDGGVVNNFPVNRVKEMGADIIIGVDLAYLGLSILDSGYKRGYNFLTF